MKFKPDDDDMLSVREAIRAQTAVHGVYVSILIAILGRSSEAFWFGTTKWAALVGSVLALKTRRWNS